MYLTSERPEEIYRSTTDEPTRRRLEMAVVTEHRDRVRAYVRATVPQRYQEEAEHVGMIGLILALKRYDPALAGPDRGQKCFWGYAHAHVRNAVQSWIDEGVLWRPRPRKARDNTALARLHRYPASMDEAMMRSYEGGDVDVFSSTYHDIIADNAPTPEELVAAAEKAAHTARFMASLSANDRELICTEDPRRRRSRRYLLLVEAAKAALQGDEQRGSRDALRGNTDSVRP
jgi:hypothetical protein